jgi:hypothetical protein
MRRLMPVGVWALLLALVVVAAPGDRLLGATNAYAYGDDPAGGFSDQDSGSGGGAGGSGTSYGDPDGPMAGKLSRGGYSWRSSGLGGWRGAGIYGQTQVGFVGRVWTVRNLMLSLRIYYLRF